MILPFSIPSLQALQVSLLAGWYKRRLQYGRDYQKHRAPEKRHAYYLKRREQILASNKRCRDRRKHLWKKNPRTGNAFKYSYLVCSDCGQRMPISSIRRYMRGGKVLFARCLDCVPPLEIDVEQIEMSFNHKPHHINRFDAKGNWLDCKSKVLENNCVFLYDECLEPEQDDRKTMLEAMYCAIEDLCFRKLNPQQAKVIEYRFTHDLIARKVAEKFGVTRERIRQIEQKAFRILRTELAKLEMV